MSASLRACWSEMYVVIRVVHESGTDVAHRTLDAGGYTSASSGKSAGTCVQRRGGDVPLGGAGGPPVGAPPRVGGGGRTRVRLFGGRLPRRAGGRGRPRPPP